MEYEKEGYTWMEDETLENLAKEERVKEIKRNALKRFEEKKANSNSPYLTDILEEAEGEGCAACFI
ncbi:MAG: phosphoadenosine phosphosulfate reductase, partial [Flavobacteriales bacterium]